MCSPEEEGEVRGDSAGSGSKWRQSSSAGRGDTRGRSRAETRKPQHGWLPQRTPEQRPQQGQRPWQWQDLTASRFFVVVILQKEAISLGRGGSCSLVSCSPGWPYVAEDVLNSTRTSRHHLLNARITCVQEPSLFSLLLTTLSNNELYGVKDLGVSPLPSPVAGRNLRHTFHKQKLEGTYFLPSLFFPYQSLFLVGLHACYLSDNLIFPLQSRQADRAESW